MAEPLMDEGEFRRKIQQTLEIILKSLDEVDPDVAECEIKPGQLTIVFGDRTRCILSTQPSVRQLWLALASRGTAYHFNHEAGRWVDDKGKGIELFGFLENFLREQVGPGFSLKR